jgi:hypothetical protein
MRRWTCLNFECFKRQHPSFLYLQVSQVSDRQGGLGCLGCLCFETPSAGTSPLLASLPECSAASDLDQMNCFCFHYSAREPPLAHLPSRVRHGIPIPLYSENKVQAEASVQSAQSDFELHAVTPGAEDLSTVLWRSNMTQLHMMSCLSPAKERPLLR